jgi:arylsulfatase A-like enzyme
VPLRSLHPPLRAALCAIALLGCHRRHEGPPDLLLVSFDTTRADRLGVYGGPAGLTPNLDRFAAESVTFLHAYSQSTFTAPSHASMFSSRYPPELMRLDRHPEYGDKPTLPQVLGTYGYHTGAFVAGGDLSPELKVGVGFDVYTSPADFGSFYHTVPPALAWLDGLADDKPWFLFLHTYESHTPYGKPPPIGSVALDATYDGPGALAVHTAVDRIQDHVFVGNPGPVFNIQRTLLRPHSSLGREEIARALAMQHPAPIELGPADFEYVHGAYDGAIAYADAWFGLLLSELDARGVLDHTVIVVMGDHGEALGEHGLYNHCCELDDATTHVPLIVRLPDKTGAGTKVDGLVELTDILPTLLELAGATPPAGARGVSLVPALHGAPFAGRAAAFTVGTDGMRMTSVRTAAGRLTFEGIPAWMDEATDLVAASALPGPSFQVEDLDAAQQAAARTTMVALLSALDRTDPGAAPELSPALKESLQKHGYWDAQ